MSDTVEVYLPRAKQPVLLDCQDFCDVWQTHHWNHRKDDSLFSTNGGKDIQKNIASLILRPAPPLMADHINRNKFDNRRVNLRIATKAENSRNKGKTKTACSSRFKGVCWDKDYHKWRSAITVNYVKKFIGLFDDEISAAQAYNDAALSHFGAFACLNDISERGAL